MSMPLSKAKEIYDNYMKGFTGVAKYQTYCKQAVLDRGYVTLNPITGHKSYWWDWKACMLASEYIAHNDFEGLRKFNNKIHYIFLDFHQCCSK